MKKLRLVKPWYLHAVRQRVALNTESEAPSFAVISKAPAGEMVRSLTPRRVVAGSLESRSVAVHGNTPNQAPHSDVPFVCSNNGLR